MKEIRVKPKELKIECSDMEILYPYWGIYYCNSNNSRNVFIANIRQNPNNKTTYSCKYYSGFYSLSDFILTDSTIEEVFERVKKEWTEYCISTIPDNFEIIEIIDNENN